MATSRKTSSGSKSGKQTQSRSRRKAPGTTGEGEYYHVEVRPSDDFVTFRTQDVGDPVMSSAWRASAEPDRGPPSNG